MAETSPTQNLIPNGDPQLFDLLQLMKKDIFLSLNCHAICQIEEFFPSEQTATVSLQYKQTYFEQAADGSFSPKLVDYPTLVKCPVYIYGGGDTGALTFPIAKGDNALVCFNDRDIDGWYAGKTSAAPPTNRLHSFSDAIILVGLRPTLLRISSYDMDRGLLKYKDAKVGVGKSNKVLIGNNSNTLQPLLDTLITQIKDLVTTVNNLVTQTAAITVTGVLAGPAVSGPPANAAAITALASQLTTITTGLTQSATNIGGLLE